MQRQSANFGVQSANQKIKLDCGNGTIVLNTGKEILQAYRDNMERKFAEKNASDHSRIRCILY